MSNLRGNGIPMGALMVVGLMRAADPAIDWAPMW